MGLNILIFGSLTFLGCLILHVLIWRYRIPEKSIFALMLIFVIIPACILLAVIIIDGVKDIVPLSTGELTALMLFHLALSSIYISSYPAAQAVSPSLDILLIVAGTETKKISREDIIKQYADTKMIRERIDDLLTDSLISRKGEYLNLKPISEIIVRIFVLYRKILGLPVGEG